jgi:hypothetical protein
MGHLAYVGVLARDGRVHYIFVRHAEPRVVASLLVKHYSTYAKARSLIMQGECSVIGPTLEECRVYRDATRREITDAAFEFRDMVCDPDRRGAVKAVYMFWPLDVGINGVEYEDGGGPTVDTDFDDGVEPDAARGSMEGTWKCVSRDFITLHE